MSQFLSNPFPADQISGNIRIWQILERLQFPPVCAVDVRVCLEVLGLECMLVEIDDFAFQEGHDMGVVRRRGLVGNIVRLHRSRQSHFIVVDVVDGDLDRPVFVSTIC